MNRRTVIQAVIAGIASLFAPRPVEARPYSGWMDPFRCQQLRNQGIYLRVIYDGRDVTDRCYVSDDTAGYVGLFKIPYLIIGDNLAREVLHGRVEYLRVNYEEWERLRERNRLT